MTQITKVEEIMQRKKAKTKKQRANEGEKKKIYFVISKTE